jgi:hypothetical protein
LKTGLSDFEALSNNILGKIKGKACPHFSEIPRGLRPSAIPPDLIPPRFQAFDFDPRDRDWENLPWKRENTGHPFIIDLGDIEFDHRLLGGMKLNNEWNDIAGEVIGGLQGSGTDTLAFYKSIRNKDLHPFPGKWGIFYFDYGIKFVGEAFADFSSKRISFKRRYRAGLDLLRLHELYHFKVDAWSMVMEASARKPLYERYKSMKDTLIRQGHYFEESLANRYAIDRLNSNEVRRFFEQFIRFFQPAQYQLDLKFVGGDAKHPRFPDHGTEVLSIDVMCRAEKSWAMQFGWMEVFCASLMNTSAQCLSHYPQNYVCPHPAADNVWGIECCPEYLIAGLGATDAISDAFKGLPSRKEFMKFLKSYLSAEPESRTDHEFWRLDNREKLKVPNPHSKTIKPWEFTNTLRKAGMNLSDYTAARKDTAVWKRNCPRSNPVPSIA